MMAGDSTVLSEATAAYTAGFALLGMILLGCNAPSASVSGLTDIISGVSDPEPDRHPWSGPTSKLVYTDGSPKIVIDGTAHSPHYLNLVGYLWSENSPQERAFIEQLRMAEDTGIHLLAIHLERSDASVRSRLASYLERAGYSGYLLLRVMFNPNPSFEDSGTPMQWRNAAGKTTTWDHLGRPVPSLSAEWVTSARAYLGRVMREFDQAFPGRIAGVQLGNLETGEWFLRPMRGGSLGTDPSQRDAVDVFLPHYDQSFAADFCRQLGERLSTCDLPTVRERLDANVGRAFHARNVFYSNSDHSAENGASSASGSWRSVLMARIAGQRVAQAIEGLAAEAKRVSAQKALVFAFYGYVATDSWNAAIQGHNAVSQLSASPHLDGFVAPYAYTHGRRPKTPLIPMFAAASGALHEKLYIYEDDTRTHLAERDFVSFADDRKGATLLLLRNLVSAFLRGNGSYWLDLFNSGWFAEQSLWRARQQTLSLLQGSRQQGYRPQIALLVDDFTKASIPPFGMHERNAYDFGRRYLENTVAVAHQLGAPVRVFTLDDLLQPSFPANDFRLFIFANAFRLKEAVRQAIKDKLQRHGNTLFFQYAAGLINEAGDANPAFVSDLLGWNFGVRRGPPASGSVTLGAPIAESFGPAYPLDPHFYVSGSVDALGRYADGRVAVAQKQFADYRVVYSAIPGLSRAFFTALAQQAGVHLFIQGEQDVIEARGNMLMVLAVGSHQRTVLLPSVARTVDRYTWDQATLTWTPSTVCSDCRQVTTALEDGSLTLFRFDGESRLEDTRGTAGRRSSTQVEPKTTGGSAESGSGATPRARPMTSAPRTPAEEPPVLARSANAGSVTSPKPPDVIGVLDQATPAHQGLRVSGWACTVGRAGSTTVHIRANAPGGAGIGSWVATVATDRSSAHSDEACNNGGGNVFDAILPKSAIAPNSGQQVLLIVHNKATGAYEQLYTPPSLVFR
jgi:hypothetical protein